MTSFYWSIFSLCCVAAAGLLIVQQGAGMTDGAGNVGAFKWHMAVYVAIYSLMMREFILRSWCFHRGFDVFI